MQTVIVRLSAPSGDGRLHGLVEVVGRRTSEVFTDDDELLTLIRKAGQGSAKQRSDRDPDGDR